MKNLNLILIAMMLMVSSVLVAQNDNFNYQAAIRDASGEILQNQSVAIVFSIKEGSAAGTEVYAEIHTATTNDQGLVNLSIGAGTPTVGTFSVIDWPSNSHFLNVQVNGTDMGTSEFKSVPYANYAATAGNVFSGDYNDLTNIPQTGSCCGFRASVTATQQVIPANIHTTVEFVNQNFDPDNVYNFPTSIFTAPSDGFYHFDTEVGLTGTTLKYLYLQVNGNFIKGVSDDYNGYYTLSANVYLNAGDEVTVVAYSFTSSSTVIWNGAGNSFSGYKVY